MTENIVKGPWQQSGSAENLGQSIHDHLKSIVEEHNLDAKSFAIGYEMAAQIMMMTLQSHLEYGQAELCKVLGVARNND